MTSIAPGQSAPDCLPPFDPTSAPEPSRENGWAGLPVTLVLGERAVRGVVTGVEREMFVSFGPEAFLAAPEPEGRQAPHIITFRVRSDDGWSLTLDLPAHMVPGGLGHP